MILSYRMNCNKKDKVIENIRNEIHRINIQRDDSDNSVNVFFELLLQSRDTDTLIYKGNIEEVKLLIIQNNTKLTPELLKIHNLHYRIDNLI